MIILHSFMHALITSHSGHYFVLRIPYGTIQGARFRNTYGSDGLWSHFVSLLSQFLVIPVQILRDTVQYSTVTNNIHASTQHTLPYDTIFPVKCSKHGSVPSVSVPTCVVLKSATRRDIMYSISQRQKPTIQTTTPAAAGKDEHRTHYCLFFCSSCVDNSIQLDGTASV